MTAWRLGGDEFAILLALDEDTDGVNGVCRRIVDAFAKPINFCDTVIQTSLSLGVALFPTDGDNQDVLHKSADLAPYDAKRSGRNVWRSYRPELRPPPGEALPVLMP